MSDQPRDDHTYHEQQLEILLDNAPGMPEFPAGEAAKHCVALGSGSIVYYSTDYNTSQLPELSKSRAILLAEAFELLASRFGPNEFDPDRPYHFHISKPNPHLAKCLEAAHEWFLKHMSANQAHMLYRTMTGGDVRKRLPMHPDLSLMVRCGLKAGLPQQVVCEEDQHSRRPIEDVVRTCHHFFPIEIEVLSQAYLRGDNPGYIDVSTIKLGGCTITVGTWHRLFRFYQDWWDNLGPILP